MQRKDLCPWTLKPLSLKEGALVKKVLWAGRILSALAVLLTGYLSGATAIHVRTFTPFNFPFVVGALDWGGLYLRNAAGLRAIIPLRS